MTAKTFTDFMDEGFSASEACRMAGIGVAKRQTADPQRERDAFTFSMFIDCGRSAFETARQMGISQQTVRARVRRHIRNNPRNV